MRRRFLLAVAFIAAGCHGRVREGNALLASGKVLEAQTLAESEVRKRPDDAEARLLLARVYMRELAPDKAANALQPIADNAKFALQIGKDYWDAATIAAQANAPREGARSYWAAAGPKNGDRTKIATLAATAARYDPGFRTGACKMMLGLMDKTSYEWRGIADMAGSVDASCKHETIRQLHSWLDSDESTTAPIADLEAIGTAAKHIDASASIDFARTLRDLADRTRDSDRTRAVLIMQAADRVDMAIYEEPASIVLRYNLGLDRKYEGQMIDATLTQYSGSPLDATKRVIRDIGGVLDMYASDHHRYPLAANIQELQVVLKDYLRAALPMVDGWSSTLMYVSSRDHLNVRLISGGADRHIDAASQNLDVAPKGTVDEYGADLIWESGKLVQEPDAEALHKYDAVNGPH